MSISYGSCISDGSSTDSNENPTRDDSIGGISFEPPCRQVCVKAKNVPVSNFFRIKYIEDGQSEKLHLHGTFIQRIFDCEEFNFFSDFKDSNFFKYRINRLPYGGTSDHHREDDDCLKWRKTVIEKDLNQHHKTLEFKAPMDVSVVHDWFPFHILRAKVMVELTSNTSYRPNLLLAREEDLRSLNMDLDRPEDYNDRIKVLDRFRRGDRYTKLIKAMKENMDKSSYYDFITPLPRVKYYYDKNKCYCSKFEIEFLLGTQGQARFCQMVFPMFLICSLNMMNVLDNNEPDDFEHTQNYVSNSATIGLGALFILPYIVDVGRRSSLMEKRNIYVGMIFVGLALSSFPYSRFDSKVPSYIGMILLWLSLTIPFYNILRFYRFLHNATEEAPKLDHRLMPLDFKVQENNYSNYKEKYISVEEYAESNVQTLYKTKDKGKDYIIVEI